MPLPSPRRRGWLAWRSRPPRAAWPPGLQRLTWQSWRSRAQGGFCGALRLAPGRSPGGHMLSARGHVGSPGAEVSPLPGVGGPYAQVSLAHLVQDSRFPGCLHLQLRFTPPRDGLRPQRAGFSQHCSKSIQTPLTTLSHHIAPRDPLATSSCCAPGLMPLGAWLPNPGPSLPALGPPAWRWGAVLHPHV